MRFRKQSSITAILLLALTGYGPAARGQTAPSAVAAHPSDSLRQPRSASAPLAPENLPLEKQAGSLAYLRPSVSPTLSPLFELKDSDIKFKLGLLMSVLRDTRHEGWVLAAYPDPKTSRPLIGAGFSLDVTAMPHPQRDSLNPHTFLEPSSAQLWQAAGLDSARLQAILDQFDHDLDAWQKKKFRKKIRTHGLTQELTEEEATQLLRISAIQSVYNARAYCRWFDQLTASQQMALSQMVFQMGVNLEEFQQFLAAINDSSAYSAASQPGSSPAPDFEHWKLVQSTLIQSDWARRYSSRAIGVIAMFDPTYDQDPLAAQHRVQVQVHPLVTHRHKKARTKSARAGKNNSLTGKIRS